MSVMIDTSLGEVVVDLFCDESPLAAKNFLKLCKIKYYNGCLFYNVQQNFMIQTGDPTASGKGGTSVYGLMYGEQARFFEDEIKPTSRKHNEAGLLSMANMGVPNSNGSQFFFSMRGDDMQHLDGKHTVFAKVMEGMETLEEINEQFCDDHGRPYRDIRILHTYVLDDPFDDPPQLSVPDESPLRDRPEEERVPQRLGALDKVSLEADEKTEIEREKQLREKTARSNAVVLEMIGDLPDADMKPPENVLFVCKLNPVTTDDDLEIIFTRFGTCRAEICRDHVTGDSLNYAFVEFEAIESCEEAFKKMNNVLIDDRRIRVDFSQSVAKEWSKYKGRAQGGQKLASGKGGKPMQPHQQDQNQNQNRQHQQQHQQQWEPNNGGASASSASQKRRRKWGNVPAPTLTAAFPAAAAPPGSTVTPAWDGVQRGGECRSGRWDGERSEGASRWSAGAIDKANGGGGSGGGGGGGGGEGGGRNERGVRERPREEARREEGGRRRADGEWRGSKDVDGGGEVRRDSDQIDQDRRDKGGRDNDGGSENRRAPERRENGKGRTRGGGEGGGRAGGKDDDNVVDDGSDDERARRRRSDGNGGGGGLEGGSRGIRAKRDSRVSGRSARGGGGGDDRDDDGRGHRASARSCTSDGRPYGDRGRGDAEDARGGEGGERMDGRGGRNERKERDERNGRGGRDGRDDRVEGNGRGERNGRYDRNGRDERNGKDGGGERGGRDERDERGGRDRRDGRDREGDSGGNRGGRSARKRSRSRSRSRERARGRSGSRNRLGKR